MNIALKYASNKLKNNFEIVSIAVKNNNYVLKYASYELRLKKLCFFQT